MENDNILEVRDLKVWFPIKKGVFGRTVGHVKAVDGVSFDLRRGETLGVVGESGCGKSTTSRAVLLLNKPCGGSIKVNGVDITKLRPGKEMMEYRRRVQVVFQDPQASLNPRHTIQEILTEGMVVHGLCTPEERREKAKELLASVGMPESVLDRYPHEFSGGQRQRICIARAISLKPELLICDEAVSALDLSIRAQVLDLLGDLKKKLGLSFLFITHDIGVVQHIADRIIVMNKGRIVESGTCDEVLKHPKEEYTKYLMAAVPRIGKPLS
ncbi:MAG: ABC transporter ATP-binding protein [Kiritimatiellae bacterium]|nr:ABC transporter ATP-binding protein [Kiritimatiellia bacterium]